MRLSVKVVATIALVLCASPVTVPVAADVLSDTDASLFAVPSPAVTNGQSATLLPDGTWLLLGGQSAGQSSTAAAIYDPFRGTTTSLAEQLHVARAWHTATVLPSGQVFVFGGVGSDGNPVAQTELYDPTSQRFSDLSAPGLTARAHHVANLLTDGRVLIAGGSGESTAVLWNPQTSQITPTSAPMVAPRADANSTLLSTSPVLIWGGIDAMGSRVTTPELYVPSRDQFQLANSAALLLASLARDLAPGVAESRPADGATDASVATPIAVRFSKPLAVRSLNSATVTLIGPTGAVATNVVPAEQGLLLFVTPSQELLPSSFYTLFIQGATDTTGMPLPKVTIGFQTAALSGSTTSAGSTASGTGTISILMGPTVVAKPKAKVVAPSVPTAALWQPNASWRMGSVKKSATAAAPVLRAADNVTALAGQVLLQNGNPLAGVAVSIGKQSTQTDSAGRFLVRNIPAGHVQFIVDGRTADTTSQHYGQFVIGADVKPGVTNTLDYTIWMPVIDVAHAVSIPSPTTKEVDVTSPLLPGVTLKIPAGVVIREPNGKLATSVSLTPVPLDRSPFPIPPFSMYFVIQPGGAMIQAVSSDASPGAQIVYPNTRKRPPGSRDKFMYYDPAGRGWTTYGRGRVSPSGKQIDPDGDVNLPSFSGFGDLEAGDPPPGENPPVNGCQGQDGEPVDCATGLFLYSHVDLVVPDTIPIVIRRTYQSSDTFPRNFGIGFSHDYRMFLYNDAVGGGIAGAVDTNFQTLQLVLSDGSLIPYARTASSSQTGLVGLQMASGATPSRFYGSTIIYDGVYLVLTLKDGTVYKFNSTDGRFLRQIVDRNGQTLQLNPAEHVTNPGYVNDTQENFPILQILSPNGRWVTIEYVSPSSTNYPQGTSQISRITDSSGRVVSYDYDSSGRLIQVTYPDGGQEQYTYVGATNQIESIILPNRQTHVTNVYDANGRVIKQTLPDQGTYRFAYVTNGAGKVTQTTITDPNGKVRVLAFNSAGYVTSETKASGTSVQQVTTYQRDPNSNQILSATDALGRVTQYGYDTMGNMTSITRLAGTANAVTSRITYTPDFNQVASVIDPLNHTTSFGYDARGNLTNVKDALNNIIATFTVDPATGRTIGVTDALQHTTSFGYNGTADLVSLTDALSHVTTRDVDALGRPVRITDPLHNPTYYRYDPVGRVSQVTDSLGATTVFGYDYDGNLTSVTDANQHTTQYQYDTKDRLTQITYPSAAFETFGYDYKDNRTSHLDRAGQLTNYTYDALNRLTLVSYGAQSGSPQSTVGYTYDAGNRITQIADSTGGTLTESYDSLDRLTGESGPKGSVTYSYDAASRRTGMTVTGGSAVAYGYDNANRLTSITQGSSSVGIQYDNASRRTTLTLPNGIQVAYGYDNANRLTGLTYSMGATSLGNLSYVYDDANRLIHRGGSLDTLALPAAMTGNYDADNRLTQLNTTTLTYDANGNLKNDGTLQYSWNARNELTQLTGTHSASFGYDGLGRRATKTIDGATTGYLYDGLNPVQEQGSTNTNLLTGLSIDEIFQRTSSTGTRTYLTDALNSTIALTDPTGAIVTSYIYEPYGNTTSSGETSANPVQYTGRENDNTGLYYYRARYYHPGMMRFVTSDPIGLRGGINGYAYVQGNPYSFRDPNGNDIVGAIVGGVIGGVQGAVGAALAPGSDGWDMLGGALGGAAAGAVSGAIDGGIVGGLAGALGDLAGQEFANLSKGRSLGCVNLGEVLGAGIGGFVGGAQAGKMVGDGVPLIEAAWAGAVPGTVGSAIGNQLGGN